MKLPVALTIAGSDSGGGAGIQADLKTFAVLGVHGTCAITAITAQNTVTVTEILELPPSLVRAQIETVAGDLEIKAAKTGMLSSASIIAVVAGAVGDYRFPLVVDPVMVAKGGAKLLRDEAVEALRSRLLPLATVLTPNLPEAEVLLERPIKTLAERRQAAEDLVRLGPRAVVLKGGHGEEAEAIDILFDGDRSVELRVQRIQSRNTHGSGCVFSAAIAAELAKGMSLVEAVHEAKNFVTGAIRASIDIGSGHGPVNPAFRLSP